jgi:hypothetical protein
MVCGTNKAIIQLSIFVYPNINNKKHKVEDNKEIQQHLLKRRTNNLILIGLNTIILI